MYHDDSRSYAFPKYFFKKFLKKLMCQKNKDGVSALCDYELCERKYFKVKSYHNDAHS
jgi:hypothetical protein